MPNITKCIVNLWKLIAYLESTFMNTNSVSLIQLYCYPRFTVRKIFRVDDMKMDLGGNCYYIQYSMGQATQNMPPLSPAGFNDYESNKSFDVQHLSTFIHFCYIILASSDPRIGH